MRSSSSKSLDIHIAVITMQFPKGADPNAIDH